MAVEDTGYYDNFCIYCNGSGVKEDFDGETVPCSTCGGLGQWDDEQGDWGFMPVNSGHTVMCVLCGAHGMGLPTRNADGEPFAFDPYYLSRWQLTCWAPHIYFCACGKAFPKTQSLGAHVAANRRHRNPGHGSLERVGY